MAYDIYGNILQRGHCEVHPHVHEEYPCSICMAERQQHDQQQSHEQQEHIEQQMAVRIKELEAARSAYASEFDGDVGSIHESIRKLKQERDQLQAKLDSYERQLQGEE